MLGACASETRLAEGQPKVVRGLDIAAYAIFEECIQMPSGDRLDYEFTSNQPVDFNIHYHEGATVLMPIVRDKTYHDSGLFAPIVPQQYCLMWEAGPGGALVDYRIVVRK